MESLEKSRAPAPVSLAAADRTTPPARSPGDVLVAIPAYNEERFIGSVVLQVRLQGFPVLVIDDGSSDRTAAVAAAAGAEVERHERNGGKAQAVNTAFQFARTTGVTVLVIMDGDSQHHASEIGRLLEPIRSGWADIVIGSRFLAASNGHIPTLRSLGQRGMTVATNLASGTAVSDSQSGFRAFSRSAIEALLFSARGFSVEGEMQFQARDHNLRVVEMPITARYDDPPKRNVLRHGIHVLDGVLRLAVRHRPLLFFGVPGMTLLLGAFGFGVLVTDIYQTTQVLAVGYALLTVLGIIVGLLASFTGIMLHAVRGTFLDLDKRLVVLGATRLTRETQTAILSGLSEAPVAVPAGSANGNGHAE
jgi:glycosyltransferase involved in cell wall biosynthesis